MRSLAVASFTKDPAKYEILELPTPVISLPDDILVKVHATSLNPADVFLAGGHVKLLLDIP